MGIGFDQTDGDGIVYPDFYLLYTLYSLLYYSVTVTLDCSMPEYCMYVDTLI